MYHRPAFGTSNPQDTMEHDDELTHSLDFTSPEPFKPLPAKQMDGAAEGGSPSTSRTCSPHSPRSQSARAPKPSSKKKPKG